MANAMLGAGAMAGARVWQRDLRLRIVIGPLKRARFDAFLPGGEAARALASMLSMMTGVSLEYEVQLVLCAKEVEGASLADDRSGGRLGWDTFLVTGDTAPTDAVVVAEAKASVTAAEPDPSRPSGLERLLDAAGQVVHAHGRRPWYPVPVQGAARGRVFTRAAVMSLPIATLCNRGKKMIWSNK